MTQHSKAGLITSLRALLAARPELPLEATFIYEEPSTRQWATEVFHRLEQTAAGKRKIRSTWWKIEDFRHPGVLAGAVSTTMRAELIVVALRASEGLPLPFYFWVNAWLPHHLTGSGVLVALVGPAEPGRPEAGRLREYLRSVARQGRFEFFLQERRFETRPRAVLRAANQPAFRV